MTTGRAEPRVARRWRRTAAGALVLVAASALVFAVGAAAGGCLAVSEAGNRWHPVPLPPVTQLVSLVQLDDDPCDLVAAEPHAVWVSQDGGQSWRRTYRPDEDPPITDRPIVRLFAEGLGPRTVLLALAPAPLGDERGRTDGGLLYSTDAGTTFREASSPGMSGFDLVAATGLHNPGDGWDLYLAGHARIPRGMPGDGTAVGASVFQGVLRRPNDSPSTLAVTAQPQSAVLRPDRLAINPLMRDEVWANDTGGGSDATRLWRLSDTTLPWKTDLVRGWSPVPLPQAGAVRDVVFAVQHGPDGGVRPALLVAGDFGLLRTTDGGSTWAVAYRGSPVQAVRAEPRQLGSNLPETLMAIVAGVPHRATLPQPLQPVTAGLPEGCAAEGLTRNAPTVAPDATYLVYCAGSGRYHRYRHVDVPGGAAPSSAASLPTVPGVPTLPPPPPFTPPAPSPGPANFPVVPMTDLKVIALPSNDGHGGNLAFDGQTLYYTDAARLAPTSDQEVVIHRVTAASGAVQPDLIVRLGPDAGQGVLMLSADIGRRLLYLLHWPRVYAYDLTRRTLSLLFELPPVAGDRFSYDPSLDGFVVGTEMQRHIRHYDRQGRELSDSCMYSHDFANASPLTAMIAAIVATGDGGGLYVQTEDDSTIFRLDRWCRTITAYGHRTFSEGLQEDDSMACDGITFGLPAIWIRDAQLRTATAYAVPTGFCAFPSQVVPLPPRPGAVPPVPVPAPQPVPQPAPQPNPGPVQQPAPQVQPQVQAQPQAQAQAQGQIQAQQQVQQQAQQQLQAGMVPQRQAQPQAATVQVPAAQGQGEYAMTRRRRRVLPSPAVAGVAAMLLAAYGAALSRQFQPARSGWRDRGGAVR